jgi:hypothetical protein
MVFQVAMHLPEPRRSVGTIGEGRRTCAEQGPDRGDIAISLIIMESSLMAPSDSLLTRKIPCSDAQGISAYRFEIDELFGAFAWA